ncbi:MAG: 2-isopropylmalate synthase [Candidatus Micrarchaeia archaeon]|jgi:2-isopropylmalate synthase
MKNCAVVDISPVRKGMNLPKKVMVFDTTLRDGEQTPGIAITAEQKKDLAFALDGLGVDVLEAGFPRTSAGERQVFKDLSSRGLRHAKLCGLARCDKEDIDAVVDSGANYVHIFIATSPLHMKHKLHLSQEQVLEKAVECTEYVKARGALCEFSAEDATRSEYPFLEQVYCAVQAAGADKINVPDTVGATVPPMMRLLVSRLAKKIKIPIAVHCHDDFGLAVANSLAAVEGGARQVHCTINGIGERAGNASLEETVMALKVIYGVGSNVQSEKLYSVSQLVSRYTKAWPAINKAIVGENAFSHGAGIHVHGVLGNALTYEPIDPAIVGQRRKIVYGKLTGIHAIESRVREMGLNPSPGQLEAILAQVKRLGDAGKAVRDAELEAIASEAVGKKKMKKVLLEDAQIITSKNKPPLASVTLRVAGKLAEAKNVSGDGPVDAALKAMQAAISRTRHVRLKDYRLEAIGGGSDALCEVKVVLEDLQGNEAVGHAVGGDIVMASVEAMVDGLNGLL